MLLSATSEWLIQIEATQDLLERAELYFGIKVPEVLEKTRKEGTDSKESSWLYSFLNTGREISAFALRRSSKLIQSTLFATMAPAAAMLTLAIMGGTSTFPWQHNSVNMKTLMAPLLAATVPYFMETLANSLERGKFATTLT